MTIFSFNELEYFSYVNLLIVSLMLFYLTLFMVIYASALILNSVYYNDVFIEVLMTLVSFAYIILIISPGLLLFLDYDFISASTNFNVYILGYQWAWNYNVMFGANNVSYTFDQLVLPSSAFSTSCSLFNWPASFSSFPQLLENYYLEDGSLISAPLLNRVAAVCGQCFPEPLTDSWHCTSSPSPFSSFYLCLFSNYLLVPLYAVISLYVHSFDVIHSYGYHCFGFKSDAIPGRVNHVGVLQLSFPGHFVSYCYELCGAAHTSMLSALVVLP